jgi:hypothetical protein
MLMAIWTADGTVVTRRVDGAAPKGNEGTPHRRRGRAVPDPGREGGAVIARALEEEDRSRDDLCGNQISGADNLTHWLISTQVPTWKSMVCLIQASFETPHLA